jgi:anti-sigma factor RsiW
MKDSMREELLGYLSNALDAEERERLEASLQEDHQLRSELIYWEDQLRLLSLDKPSFDPPAGLAERTCAFVFARVDAFARADVFPRADRAPATDADVETSSFPWGAAASVATDSALANSPLASGSVPLARLSDSRNEFGSGRRFRLVDLVVFAALLAGGAVMLMPAVLSSRDRAQLADCRRNLLEIGMAMQSYSDLYDGHFPWLPTEGPRAVAGTAPTTLVHEGMLDPQRLICAGAQKPETTGRWLGVPEWEEVDTSDEDSLPKVWARMSPNYGTYLGVLVNGVYAGQRNLHRATFAIAADSPSRTSKDRVSTNHGRRGQNVLFEDGHVEVLSGCRIGDDDIFLNEDKRPAAGLHLSDSVIGTGDTSPMAGSLR